MAVNRSLKNMCRLVCDCHRDGYRFASTSFASTAFLVIVAVDGLDRAPRRQHLKAACQLSTDAFDTRGRCHSGQVGRRKSGPAEVGHQRPGRRRVDLQAQIRAGAGGRGGRGAHVERAQTERDHRRQGNRERDGDLEAAPVAPVPCEQPGRSRPAGRTGPIQSSLIEMLQE